MLIVAAWTMFALGVAHIVVGLVFFRQQFATAAGEGWIGCFHGVDSRRLAFWFTVFGPLVMMGGQIAVHAVHAGDLALLKLIGYYLVAIALMGVTALPKSPFWGALLLGPVFIAGGYGWIV